MIIIILSNYQYVSTAFEQNIFFIKLFTVSEVTAGLPEVTHECRNHAIHGGERACSPRNVLLILRNYGEV